MAENLEKVVNLVTHGSAQQSAVMIRDRSPHPENFEFITTTAETLGHVVEGVNAKQINLCGSSIEIRNVACAVLKIQGRAGRIVIEDCFIGSLIVSFPEKEVELTLDLTRSRVVAFWLSNKPKVRDIRISETSFARYRFKVNDRKVVGSEISSRINRETFSILVAWAKSEGNTKLHHVMRAEELAQENEIATGMENLVLRLWGLTCDYGSAPFRPFLIIGIATSLMGLLLFQSGTSLGIPSSAAIGWRSDLVEVEGLRDNILRAVVGALEGIFSPLSVFSSRSLIVPHEMAASIAKIFHGYLSLAMFFLCGLSLRRRFKSST